MSKSEPPSPGSLLVILTIVIRFRCLTELKNAFCGAGIASLQNLDDRGWVPGLQANVLVANHDTERQDDSLNAKSPANAYTLAMIFSLAYPYGKPSILSSYEFSDKDVRARNLSRPRRRW
ncbi:hypothetical protein HGRIS_003485 [Hohenbuehelia grisea]|uniref:Alpha-amylase n=1 Tax=Hohenbuehelia grisea TaxID=104357 RepID=A0ABR3JGM8_9AGAR